MYYIVFGFLYLISLLPLRLLYILSEVAYFIMYKVFGYRKQVVIQNLNIAFPHKTEEEKTVIVKKFYRNFTDTLIETIKFISADKRFFLKRFSADYSDIHTAYENGNPVQIYLGHNFNWELANLAVPFFLPYKVLAVYSPLKNKLFDRLFKYIRSRQGSYLIAANNMRAEMLPHRNTQYIIGLIADQSSPIPERTFWIRFFGKPTGFLKGPEMAARRNDYPVVFCHFSKVRRGYYVGHGKLASLHPKDLPEGQLTKMYAEFLEGVMTKNPEMWLWSHRRWKREWHPDYGPVIE